MPVCELDRFERDHFYTGVSRVAIVKIPIIDQPQEVHSRPLNGMACTVDDLRC